MPTVPDTPNAVTDLEREVRTLASDLGVLRQLNAFGAITAGLDNLQVVGNPWIVLELHLDARTVTIELFKSKEEEEAVEYYAKKEIESRGGRNRHVVLVSARSVNELRRAYPNFFTDLNDFRKLVEETID